MPKTNSIAPYKAWNGYWCVQTPVDLRPDRSKAPRRFFESKKEADAYAEQLQGRRDEITAPLFRLEKQKLALVTEALTIAGDAESLLDAAKYWRTQRPAEVATLRELAIRCVADREQTGWARKYCAGLKLHLEAFARFHGEATLAHEIQPHHVKEWVFAKLSESQFTKETRLRNVRTMFAFGLSNKLVASNPAAEVAPPVKPDTSPIILCVEECERLMRTAEHAAIELVPFLSLCLFGGLRPEAEALRIHKDSIRENHIEVFGKRVRARNRRLVTLNDTLAAWIKDYPIPSEPLVNHIRKMRRLRALCVIGQSGPCRPLRWHQDVLRHSFVSYHCATHGITKTAQEAGHSEDILLKHYRELVSKSEAEAFWGILPSPRV